MEKIESEIMKLIMCQCPECSSNDTIIKDGEMRCNGCDGLFVHNKIINQEKFT